jgi:hypothetical protein
MAQGGTEHPRDALHGRRLPTRHPSELCVSNKGIDLAALKIEADRMPQDTQCWSRKHKRVITKRSRANNCITDHAQEPDIAKKKGTILSFATLPELSKVRALIGALFGEQYANLWAETNRYGVGTRTGIGYHGDTERCVVVAIRVGGGPNPIAYQWFHKSRPVGEQMRFPIDEGSMYIMGAKAVGKDWKTRKIPTLRHAAGHEKFMPSPAAIVAARDKKRAAASASICRGGAQPTASAIATTATATATTAATAASNASTSSSVAAVDRPSWHGRLRRTSPATQEEQSARHRPLVAPEDEDARSLNGDLATIQLTDDSAAAQSGFRLVSGTPHRGSHDHSAEYERIKGLAQDSLDNLVNVKVWRVENPELRAKFQARASIGNVKQLWHSTNIYTDKGQACLNPADVCETGFSSEENGSYGRGAYFAKHALYCTVVMDPPSWAPINRSEERADGFLILADVALGNCYPCGVEVNELTANLPDGLGAEYDSWTGTEGNFRQKNLDVTDSVRADRLKGKGFLEGDDARRLWSDGQKYCFKTPTLALSPTLALAPTLARSPSLTRSPTPTLLTLTGMASSM